MNFSWAIDLDPKGANNQIKEAINKRYLPDDEDTTMGLDAADTTLEQSLGMSDEDHMGVESDWERTETKINSPSASHNQVAELVQQQKSPIFSTTIMLTSSVMEFNYLGPWLWSRCFKPSLWIYYLGLNTIPMCNS